MSRYIIYIYYTASEFLYLFHFKPIETHINLYFI